MATTRRLILGMVVVLMFTPFAACWLVGGKLIAPARHACDTERVRSETGLPIESLTLRSANGRLAVWSIPREGANATVILLHPIRADRRSMLTRARLLHDAGYSTLLVDLQAHGESEGSNITMGYRERLDVSATVALLKKRWPSHDIAVVGRSLGGAAALLASPLGIDALVLESVYPTIEEAVNNRVAKRLGALSRLVAPALLMQLEPRLGIAPGQLRPIDMISGVECPVLIVSGKKDIHTTWPETERLYAAANEPNLHFSQVF